MFGSPSCGVCRLASEGQRTLQEWTNNRSQLRGGSLGKPGLPFFYGDFCMGWIGVDFDGTLAHTVTGEPIPKMLERVKDWLAKGVEVRIVTARASSNNDPDKYPISEVYEFCHRHLGTTNIPVTCEKDTDMMELWDDRAISVERNTGEVARSEQ